MRIALAVLCVACAAPVAAEDMYPARYARAEAGVAVEVPWLAARIGRTLSGGALALDLGAGGSFEGRGFLTLTGGLEARAFTRSRVSPFARAEGGLLSQSRAGISGVVSLGGGLSLRLDREWSARAGLMRSLQVSDVLVGPDYAFLGVERRW